MSMRESPIVARNRSSRSEAPDELEYPGCPLCVSERRQFVYDLERPYRIAECRACGIHYLFPRNPEASLQLAYRDASYYGGGDSGYSDSSYSVQEGSLRATFRRFLRMLATRGMAGGDLLEIGCGYGYLLDEARGLFKSRAGTDYSTEAAAAARSTGAEVYVGGVEQLPADARFDCVIATQVIEHVYDPWSFVDQLTRRSRPGGHICLATPNYGGALRKLMGKRWPSFKVPEHVVYFDVRTLGMLLQQAGLRQVRPIPYLHAFPLELIARKFGVRVPGRAGRVTVWIPASTIAMCGKLADE